MSLPHVGDTTVHAAIAGGSFWYGLLEFLSRGWSWAVVPPLLAGIAAVIGAYQSLGRDRENWRDRSQARRQRDELHALELERIRRTIEQLPTRN